jgi:uncharacterized protein YecE (DUF72 family)
MEKQKRIHIGTSGWHYDHWKGPFYPQELMKNELLQYYARHFQTVEVNNSFYQLPKKQTVQQWRESVPADFTFSVKGSRYITHMKKLKDPRQSLSSFLKVVKEFDDRLGIVLFQLPPNWNCNHERLHSFLAELPTKYRYALEFRDPDWFNKKTYDILAEYGAAFCIYELAGRLSPKEVTADFVYIRLHGPGDAYQGSYDTSTLAGWAGACSSWSDAGKEIYCYFDNDEAGYAAQNALKLQKMLDGR